MTRASSPIPLSPVLLVASANALTGLSCGRPWGRGGVLFVHHVGFRSQFDVGMGHSSWPIPRGEDCGELARFAEAERILSAEAPAMGDIFLIWSEKKRRFRRTGIVAFVEKGERCFPSGLRYFDCRTIEAFTPDDGTGDGVKLRSRNLSPERGDRLVRWVDLDARGAVSDPLSREFPPAASSPFGNLVDLARMREVKVA